MVSLGPERVHMRFKIGILDIDDVNQQFRPDFAAFFYYKPVEPVDVSQADCRFDNIDVPKWKPHFDFMKEVEEVLITDESYWVDTKSGYVFGIVNWIPHIQERFDHKLFPFDRQILDIQCHLNNCQLAKWELPRGDFPPELSLIEERWSAQVELNAEADSWSLDEVVLDIINDNESHSCITHFQVYIERNSSYYMWNIVFVYSLIIAAQAGLLIFPYDQSRFEFAMTLALTTVAFQFVTRDLVPQTSYLTLLDKYTLIGLGIIGARFVADFVLQLDPNLIPEDGRACDGLSSPTICEIDIYVTIGLLGIWVFITAVAWFLNWRPNMVREKWSRVNVGDSDSLRVIKGVLEFNAETRQIVAEDIFDATEGKVASEQVTASVDPEEENE